MVGYTLAAVGVLSIIVQGGLIGRIIRAIGERRSAAGAGEQLRVDERPAIGAATADRNERIAALAVGGDPFRDGLRERPQHRLP